MQRLVLVILPMLSMLASGCIWKKQRMQFGMVNMQHIVPEFMRLRKLLYPFVLSEE